ncbi:MAG: hypothetical protein AAFZ52_01000 [Bacteroidota bacterium]
MSKLLEKGQLDRAYALALRRCTRGRAPVKQKRVDEFFAAYAAVQRDDFAYTQSLRSTSGGEKWAELYRLYTDLHLRSIDLANLFPEAVDFTGNPDLLPANLEVRREEARREAGAYVLGKAAALLPAARAGYKPAARTAYHHYTDALVYLPERRDELLATQDSLADLGTLRILLYAPDQPEADLLRERLLLYKPLYRYWTALHVRDPGTRLDLEAEVVYETYKDRGYRESNSCRTYTEKVLDHVEKKKVKVKVNDTTEVEKIIEIKHYVEVSATVTTYKQQRSISVLGFVAAYPPGEDTPVWRDAVGAGNTWRNTYQECRGDARALPACSCSGFRRAVPSAESLLPSAICGLADRARAELIDQYAPRLRRDERRAAERWALFRK